MLRDRLPLPLLFAAVLALLSATACSEAEESPRLDGARSASSASPPTITPARYATGLVFVGFDPGSPRLYFRFGNETTGSSLVRDYGGWISLDPRTGWERTLSVRDTLPTPRAAWRVLPTDQLHLSVAGRGEISSLVHGDSTRRMSLLPSVRSAEWLGSTGQREGIGMAELRTDAGPVQGLLMERREARPRDIPVPGTVNRIFLVTCGEGCGLLILRDEGDEGSPTTAHAWLGGEAVQEEVSLVPVGGSGGNAAAWRFRLPNARFEGQLSPGRIAVDSLPENGAGLRVRGLEGSMTLGGERRAARGVLVETRGP